MLKNGLGYTEMVRVWKGSEPQPDDYVEEYADEVTELTALEQLQKKIHKKVLEPVSHSNMHYIPIRKDFYVESPLITKMTDVAVSARRER